MNQQLALSYPASYVGREVWQRQLEAIRAAVKHLGPKEVAYELDVGATHLSDSLNERDRKHWHAQWTHVLKSMLVAKNDDVALELLQAIVEADVESTPYAITDDQELTPEEEIAQLRRELAKFGDRGRTAASRVPKARTR